jgi:hypothetical protein
MSSALAVANSIGSRRKRWQNNMDWDLTEFNKNMKALENSIEKTHLKSMIETIAQNPEACFDLREGPLYKRTPAEVYDMLEDLGWKQDEHEVCCSHVDVWQTFYHDEWDFDLVLFYSGFYWTMSLCRKERKEIDYE